MPFVMFRVGENGLGGITVTLSKGMQYEGVASYQSLYGTSVGRWEYASLSKLNTLCINVCSWPLYVMAETVHLMW